MGSRKTWLIKYALVALLIGLFAVALNSGCSTGGGGGGCFGLGASCTSSFDCCSGFCNVAGFCDI